MTIPVSKLGQYALHEMYQRHQYTIRQQNAEFAGLIQLIKESDKVPDGYTLNQQLNAWLRDTTDDPRKNAVTTEEDTTQPTKEKE